MQATAVVVALGPAASLLAEEGPDAAERARAPAAVVDLARSGPVPPRQASGTGEPDTLTLPRADDPATTAAQQAVVDAPLSLLRLAQFQFPAKPPAQAAPPKEGASPTTIEPTTDDATGRRPRTFTQALTYQYGYGSESAISYRRNADLNKRVADNLAIFNPQINGIVIYRPADWVEMTLEMIAEMEIPSQQPETVTLPNGQVVAEEPTRSSLLVDQAFVTIRRVTAPFEFSVGRRNYEDERHWLYDTSMDVGAVTLRSGALRVDAFAGREVYKNLNLIPGQYQVKDRINTSAVYVDYRGIEDYRLAAYTLYRDDLTHQLGQPRLWGVRAIGRPSDALNFWTDVAVLKGTDAAQKKFSGTGFDVGLTYRFLDLPLRPNFTVGYAYGSGDDNPDDGKNHTFQQSGLQSNEGRFAGVSKFKYYGEALDPELSNLKILTLGFGFWPAPNVTVDLVYHKYRLNKIADEIAGSPVTAQMNQIDILVPSPDPDGEPILVPQLSKDVGQGVDVVVGLRNLFGLRRLGLDLRMGWFFPGSAYNRNDGTEENPVIRRADKMFAVVAKFWW